MNLSSAVELLTLSAISAEFGYLVDHGRASACAELFAPDARLIFAAGSPKPGTLEGLSAIRDFLSTRQAQTHVTTRHVATNFRMDWDGGPQARLESLLTVFRSEDPTPQKVSTLVAEIHEVFTRADGGGWLISERSTTPIFATPAT